MDKKQKMIAIVGIIIVLILLFGTNLYKKIDPGHVGVATLFGDVVTTPYEAGLHYPTNPFYKWSVYDIRDKTHKEVANVPSQDQLQTKVEVSIQYKLVSSQTPSILSETGTIDQILEVHIIPKLRSILRAQGKSIKRAEDFFQEETQSNLENSLLAGLQQFLRPKGVAIEAVLIRDITLPSKLITVIEDKKEREQAVEKQKAELERVKLEEQQKVAAAQSKGEALIIAATAEKKAAQEESEKRKILADVRAYEIEKINTAIGSNPNYVKLETLKTLQAISKDPAAKLYFINGDSPTPLPLMHLGETNNKK